MRDGDMIGRVLDTFVVAQLRAELASSASRPRLYDLRRRDGRAEVDVVVVRGRSPGRHRGQGQRSADGP
jgi:hypothetical protein